MYHSYTAFLRIFLLVTGFILISCESFAKDKPCAMSDRPCILNEMLNATKTINKPSWRDQIYREIAKTYASDGNFKQALNIIPNIQDWDTRAMTIRGIGMAVASQSYTKAELDLMFRDLRVEAEKITHPPSYAIALTYIAMSQAFAGDNEGAWKTASEMENEALRHKAYGETAEIQAEKGDFSAAQISIEKIESLSFKNKAYSTISKILADQGQFADSYLAARAISNAYIQAQSMQYLLDQQKPRDVKH